MATLNTNCDPAPTNCGEAQTVMARRRAGRLNLCIEQGTTFEMPFTYTEQGQPVDLTGVTIRSQFRPRIDKAEVLIDLSTDVDGGIVVDGPSGKITMTILPEQTADLTTYSGVWDMVITFVDGSVFRILQGEFEISRGVTR